MENTKMVPATCTQCGATLTVDQEQETAVCEYCGSVFVVDKAVNNYYEVHNHINIEAQKTDFQSALDFLNKRSERKQEEKRERAERAARSKQEQDDKEKQHRWEVEQELARRRMDQEEKAAKNRKTLLWVLGWIFLFPVTLTVFLLKSDKTKNIDNRIKYAIIVVVWLLFIVRYLGVGRAASSSSTTADSNNTTQTISEQTIQDDSTAESVSSTKDQREETETTDKDEISLSHINEKSTKNLTSTIEKAVFSEPTKSVSTVYVKYDVPENWKEEISDKEAIVYYPTGEDDLICACVFGEFEYDDATFETIPLLCLAELKSTGTINSYAQLGVLESEQNTFTVIVFDRVVNGTKYICLNFYAPLAGKGIFLERIAFKEGFDVKPYRDNMYALLKSAVYIKDEESESLEVDYTEAEESGEVTEESTSDNTVEEGNITDNTQEESEETNEIVGNHTVDNDAQVKELMETEYPSDSVLRDFYYNTYTGYNIEFDGCIAYMENPEDGVLLYYGDYSDFGPESGPMMTTWDVNTGRVRYASGVSLKGYKTGDRVRAVITILPYKSSLGQYSVELQEISHR